MERSPLPPFLPNMLYAFYGLVVTIPKEVPILGADT